LKPFAGHDYIVTRRISPSAFDGIGLDRELNGLYDGKGADTLIITGLHTNICSRHASYDAFTRGFNIITAEDGVESFTEQERLSGLEYMRRIYGAETKNVPEIINFLVTYHVLVIVSATNMRKRELQQLVVNMLDLTPLRPNG
jgi:nicotinamidase-related amidase